MCGKPSETVEIFIINNFAKWKWTAVRDCPDDFMSVLNGPTAPKFHFTKSSAAPEPWKGFWGMDRIQLDDWHYDLQLEYGYGTETSIMVTFDGFPAGSKDPTIHPVVTASRI